MKKDNILADKSFKFAVKIVDLYNHLREEKKYYILSKQVVRSGTSIGGECGGSHRRTVGKRLRGEIRHSI